MCILKEYVQLNQQLSDIKEKLEQIKPQVIGQVKKEGRFIEEESAWEIEMKEIFMRVKTCSGRESFDAVRARKDFPVLNTPTYKKIGDPYDHLTYEVKLNKEEN